MGRGPGSRFGLIPTSLSPPRHAPHRLPSSLFSFSREFLRLNPRLVVVHSRNVVWRSVEQVGGSRRPYPLGYGGEIEPGPTAVSASTRTPPPI